MSGRVHGSLQDAEAQRYGGDRTGFLDFSANLNPYGPPPSALAAASAADLGRYPDPECLGLRHALAARLRLTQRELLIGNGSSELFYLLARALVPSGSVGLVMTPAFGEYASALEAAGAQVVETPADQASAFRWDLDAVEAQVRALRPALTFLGSPNNPTGVYLQRDDVRRLAAAATPGVLVLDEAYVSFVEGPWRSQRLAPNVAIVRSLTKDFALPGLRIGYMAAPRNITQRVAAQQPSWSVSAPAQAAALACLEEGAWLQDGLARMRPAKQELIEGIEALGLACHAGAANFVLVDVDDAAAVRRRLLERRIAVRDCASFGLPRHIRVAVRDVGDCRRFLAALAECRL